GIRGAWAGGRDSAGAWSLAGEPGPAGGQGLEVRITGLKGGHSGMEIHQGRGNAIRMLNRVVRRLEPLGARIARLEGGSKRNAIPATAAARLLVPKRKL